MLPFVRILQLPALFIFLSGSVWAGPNRVATSNSAAWLMYFGDHKIAPRLGVHLEAQLRRADWGLSAQQLLLRTGINYHLGPQAFVTAGYCFVETYPYGAFAVKAAFPEHRFWEQLQIKTNLKRWEWVSRFRLEQRFSQLPVLSSATNVWEPVDAVYTNRFRSLNRFSFPLTAKTMRDHALYLSAYNEFFINFGRNAGANIFDQNRAYLALGYVFPKWGRLEIGYMEQTLIKPDGIRMENNHTVQIGFSSTADFYRPGKNKKP